jgi:hypothetical protein
MPSHLFRFFKGGARLLTLRNPVLLGFVVFGGLIFEVISRIFLR